MSANKDISKFNGEFTFLQRKLSTMARVLTGIQSSGRPHLGIILGAIVLRLELIRNNRGGERGGAERGSS